MMIMMMMCLRVDGVVVGGSEGGPRHLGSGAGSCMQHPEIACNNMLLQRNSATCCYRNCCSAPHTGLKHVGKNPKF